jgi:hypothetical protein
MTRGWRFDVHLGEDAHPRIVAGTRTHPDRSVDTLGVRNSTEARAIRVNPLSELVYQREGTLVEVVDDLLALVSPLHPRAPRLVLGVAVERLWLPPQSGS